MVNRFFKNSGRVFFIEYCEKNKPAVQLFHTADWLEELFEGAFVGNYNIIGRREYKEEIRTEDRIDYLRDCLNEVVQRFLTKVFKKDGFSYVAFDILVQAQYIMRLPLTDLLKCGKVYWGWFYSKIV